MAKPSTKDLGFVKELLKLAKSSLSSIDVTRYVRLPEAIRICEKGHAKEKSHHSGSEHPHRIKALPLTTIRS